jgi:hypothetical protein
VVQIGRLLPDEEFDGGIGPGLLILSVSAKKERDGLNMGETQMKKCRDQSATPQLPRVISLFVLAVLFAHWYDVASGEERVLPQTTWVGPSVTLTISPLALATGRTLDANVSLKLPGCSAGLAASLYVGAWLSDGTFASWRRDEKGNLYLVRDSRPHPLEGGIPLDPVTCQGNQHFLHTFSGNEPSGFHFAYALLATTIPGIDPLDPRNWLAISMLPFRFTP